MTRNLRGFPCVQMPKVQSLVPGETAIAPILASSLWAPQTRSWRQPASPPDLPLLKTAKIHASRAAMQNLPLCDDPVNHSLTSTRANRINRQMKKRCIVPTFNEPEVVTVTFNRLNLTQQTATSSEGFDINKMRALIAEQLHVDITRVTEDASFSEDLGANWLDRLELMIRVEDQFVDVEITDDDADQIE